MIEKKYLIFILVSFLLIYNLSLLSSKIGSVIKKYPLPVLDQKTKSEIFAYLKQNHKMPEDYILSKFMDHDIVFIGEYHRIKHDVKLIQNLIPLLYKAGIYNLGIEFGVHCLQERVDKLINAQTYDEQAAREIMFSFDSSWGYKEYMDIYRAAWEVNRKLPKDAPRFRVVNLNAFRDWSYIKTSEDRENPEIMKKVYPEGDSDPFMAGVIIREFVEKGQKALIYSGINHAFTRFRQPYAENGKFVDFVRGRMGNRVFDKLGEKVCTICLHAPWPDRNYDLEVYPAGGVIDALFKNERQFGPVGFDLAGTPFGELGGQGSIYQEGYKPFTLKLFADGYIYTMPISQYQGVTTDKWFVTAKNFKQAVEQIENPEFKSEVTCVEMLIDSMKRDANMRYRFRKFH